MTKTEVLDNPLKQVSVDVTIPERTFVPDFPVVCGSKGCPIDPNKDYRIKVPEGDGLVGVDSIRAGIDAEILEKMEREALAAEDAAIVDDLMRQVKAGCIMPQIYVPLQVSHIFKKEDKE